MYIYIIRFKYARRATGLHMGRHPANTGNWALRAFCKDLSILSNGTCCKPSKHWFGQFGAKCYFTVNLTLGDKMQWNINPNSKFLFKQMYMKMSSPQRRAFCLNLNVLSRQTNDLHVYSSKKYSVTNALTIIYSKFKWINSAFHIQNATIWLLSMFAHIMMTSSNGDIFRVTGPLCGEFIGHAELWCFLWSAPWINGWVNNRGAGDLREFTGKRWIRRTKSQ